MNMKKLIFSNFPLGKKTIIFLFLIFLLLFILGCSKKTCESGLYTQENECCTYVCDIDCPEGYAEGTCNCECVDSSSIDTDEPGDTNINDIFEDTQDVNPPQLPSP